MDRTALPIDAYEDQIAQSVIDFPVTVIVAETGAGKSTRVGQFLLKRGRKVVITEPRRIAARSLAKRVAKEMDGELGDVVGYRTGYEKNFSPNTKLLYATDGLEAVVEISGQFQPDVLILDEVHEWTWHTETLISWSKRRLATNQDFRLVLMSATIDTDGLARYYGQVNIISVPGRLFPVANQVHLQSDMVQEVAGLIGQERNVLVFMPGKGEINEMAQTLAEMRVNAQILPLHGDLEADDQDLVFGRYPRPKVVIATNIAQTSLTIDDIDAVVDSGLIRQIETVDGVETLVTRRISLADQEQRRGRAGRCRPGLYIDCYDGTEEQLPFPVPEIQRINLDQLVLRLKIQGIDATELEFFHQPDHETLLEAKRSLFAIGAMTKNGEATSLGKRIARFPVSVKIARMIIAAEELGVLDDVLTIAACLEVKGISSRASDDQALWQPLTIEKDSDLLAQLDLYRAASRMNGSDELRENGIHPRSFFRAREIRNRLAEVVIDIGHADRRWITLDSTENRQDIIRACLYGFVDHLYKVDRSGICTNGAVVNPGVQQRRINRHSVVNIIGGGWVVGIPFDIPVKDRDNPGQMLNIPVVNMVTMVEPQILIEIAPHLVGAERSDWVMHRDGVILLTVNKSFNGVTLPMSEVITTSWPEIKKELKDEGVIRRIRQEAIDSQRLQFERSMATYLGHDEFRDWQRSLRIEQRSCGFDPESGKEILVFLAPTENYASWRLSCFATEREAETARQAFVRASARRETLSAFPTYRRADKTAIPPPLSGALNGVKTATPIIDEQWKDMGKRWWTCPRGHSARADKGADEVYCEVCGLSHSISATPNNQPVAAAEKAPDKPIEKLADADQLAELTNLFKM